MTATPPTRAGRLVRQQSGPEGYAAFIPAPLPPDPPIQMSPELRRLHEEAAHRLGRLDGVSSELDPDRLLYTYVRREAVFSSQIEGTQSSLADLLEYENAAAPGTPVEDVREVSRCVAALQHGLERMGTGHLPLSLRLIREMHRILLEGGRASRLAPGEFRRTQNWVGGTRPGNARFVPPPPGEMMAPLDNLERFMHDEFGPTPPILKAGLAHVQFETIHPFLDGNGRIGRLLISLLLVADGILRQPFFYLSLYFKQYRADYYDALDRVRSHADWEGWLRFYLIGVAAVAREATETTGTLLRLFADDRRRVAGLGKAAGSTLSVFDLLERRVIVSPARAAGELGLTWPTVNSALKRLAELGIAREITGKRRNRLFAYGEQLDILNRDTQPLE